MHYKQSTMLCHMVNVLLLSFWLILFGLKSVELSHPLKSKLKTWHTLNEDDVYFHPHKRSISEDKDTMMLDKLVSFNAFDEEFQLSLLPAPELFTSNFKSYAHNHATGYREVKLDKSQILSGTRLGDAHSHVFAQISDKRLTASIETKNETYIVEPMWRHSRPAHSSAASGGNASDANGQSRELLVYRLSDVNFTSLSSHVNNGKSYAFCDTKTLKKPAASNQESARSGEGKSEKSRTVHRVKRSESDDKKICKISLVADHRFCKHMGNNNVEETMIYLSSQLHSINAIFKNTNWDTSGLSVVTGYGFQIEKIVVYEDPTPKGDTPRFNRILDDGQQWTAQHLLVAFGEEDHEGHSGCMAHLFTYIDFPEGQLGLAYVGVDQANVTYGICSKARRSETTGKMLHYNTGISSSLNWNQTILSAVDKLVTAHELGHNFGAYHDDEDNGENNCTPGQGHGGNYLMYPVALGDDYDNNRKFSNCSRNTVFKLLKTKGEKDCFEKEATSFCGNYHVEEGEECDSGRQEGHMAVRDPCCTTECKLTRGAVCSNRNSLCCTDDCQIAPPNKTCRYHITGLCHADTHCDGRSTECPEAIPLRDGSKCGGDGKGKCKNGTCQSICRQVGLQPCLCAEKQRHCVRCCVSPSSHGDTCQPYPNTSMPMKLNDNETCALGFCKKGVCEKQSQDVLGQVLDLFSNIAPDKIGQFLADNIVGAVLVFSLMFWIPLSCLVNFVDKQRIKARDEEEKWRSRHGSEFTRSQQLYHRHASGSVPTTPRFRVQRANINWTGLANSSATLAAAPLARSAAFGARADHHHLHPAPPHELKRSRDDLCVLPSTPDHHHDDGDLDVTRRSPFTRTEAITSDNSSLPNVAVSPSSSVGRDNVFATPSPRPITDDDHDDDDYDDDDRGPIATSSVDVGNLTTPTTGPLMLVAGDEFAPRPGLRRQEATYDDPPMMRDTAV